MKFETIFRKMTMLTFQNHCQHVKKVILNIIFRMLKKISQKFFFIFYQLQQTPTWVVYKNSNHLPGFQIKHEKAATTYCEIFYSNHLLHPWFLAQKWFFFSNTKHYIFQTAATTYLISRKKQRTPTWKILWYIWLGLSQFDTYDIKPVSYESVHFSNSREIFSGH